MHDDYFIGVHGRELDRLRAQHAAWEPETRALWARAGFGPGQRLADLGSGPGFSAIDLAQRVGPQGRIAALDKASPYLAFLDGETRRRRINNVHTVRADLTRMEVIEGPLDGAFCRFFLAFLIDDLDRVLACIHRSLKPGGVLAAMEYLTLGSTVCSPPIRGFDAHTRAWVQYYRMHGADTGVGSYLPERLTQAGFNVTYTGCVGGIARPGHRWWNWWGRLIGDFGDKLASDGLMTHDEIRYLQNDWDELPRQQHAFIHTPLLIQLVAQKTI
jgi:ubiquinone/menaquinone biosynthesis C-methylase UbiE